MDNYLRDFLMDVEELNNFRASPIRSRKIYRARFNPLNTLSDAEFRLRYRFSKENMCRIIQLVRSDLEVDTRGGGIPVEMQVMAVITYWGCHEIQEDCADIHGMSQQTLSRLAHKVAIALASKSQRFIRMPSNMTEQANAIGKFEAICGLRGIIGAIDGTHIKMRKIGGDVGQYHINKKGHYSINTQIVCDADMKICDIVCHWRGSTHDARIYRESSIKRRFEENEFIGRLIGDSGYPCTPHLITPVLRPSTEEEQRYNRRHMRTRNVVEKCFGVWKQRFRILLEVMRGSYTNIKNTIVACAVLHNLAIIFTEEQGAFGQTVMGMLNTWPSYTSELYLSNETPLSAPMTKTEEALLGSLPSLGAMVGSAIVGLLMNNLGRRNGGVLVSLPVLISWALVSVTSSIKLVLAARFFAGISGGAALVLAPIFTSEVAEDSIRGTLASASMFLYCTGIVISYVIGWCMTYKTIIWMNLFFSLACTVLLSLVTESPVYLLRKNREEDAKLSIAKYRGVSVTSMVVLHEFSKLKQTVMPSIELVAIKDTGTDEKAEEAEKEKLNQEDIEQEKPQSTSAFKLLFFQPSSRRAFIVVATVISMQVCMGIVPVQVYAKTVFEQTDPSKADVYTIFFAVVLFAGSAVTVLISDKAGRRVLIIASSVMVFVCMTTLGYLLHSKVAPPLVTVIVVFMYSFSFMFGAGTIPYVLLAEAFIPEVQSLASMIIIELVWFLNFVIIAIFPFMNSAFGIYGSFYIFGIMGLTNAVLSYMIVPETKGLSNAQIQDAFMSRKKN